MDWLRWVFSADVIRRGAQWLALAGLLACPGGLRAQFRSDIYSFAVTNYTGYVLAGDTGPAGRQAIRSRTIMFYTNSSATAETVDFRLAYQLLDGAGAPVPILDENGQTNTSYSVYQTNTLPLIRFFPPQVIRSYFLTNGAPLQPLVQLDPYQGYQTQLKVYARPHDTGSYTYFGTNASVGPRVYYDFTNTVSPDPSPNLLLTFDAASLGRTWAISNSPGQGGFPVSVAATVRRYDDFTLPPNSTNTTVTFNFQLLDTASGTPVPLQSTQATVPVRILSNDGGSPPFPVAVAVATNFSLIPAVQLDSVDKTYQIAVTLTHTEGSTVVIDHTNTIGPVQLLHFNSQLLSGSLLTYFTNLDSAPTVTNTVANDHLDLLLPVSADAGWLPGAPGHTYGDGSAIPVALFVDGTTKLENGATVALHGPSPDAACVQNICFQRSSLTLTASGAVGFVALRLPTGFSVGLGPTNRLTLATLEYPNTPLDQNLAPQGGSLTTPGPFYAVEETVPFWFAVPRLTWLVNSGQIVLNPTGGVFVRQEEDDILTSVQAALKEPNAANRISNDGYFRNAAAAGGQLIVTADANGTARISVNLALNPPELRPHFPYAGSAPGNQIPTAAGTLEVQDGLVSSNSALQVGGPVPVLYARDCAEATNCNLAQAGPARLAFTANGNQLGFTPDGGLLAYGSVPATNLTWGYVSGANFAQQAFTVSAGAFAMAGTFLRGDQTALDASERAAGLLFTGFGDATNPAYVERPDMTGYAAGFANYAGLNFRAPASGRSFIAQQDSGPYPLTPRSKYYVRFGGVSGIHESATFPTTLTLYGYHFTFTTYRLSYLDSEVWESRTDGAIAFPPLPTGPAGFTQEFEDMTFSCRGDLESADVPATSGKKHLAYWNVDFTPLSIQFKPSSADTCGTGPRWLVLGVQTTLPFIPQMLHAALGFQPNGNLVTPADGVAGTDSRFQVPAQLSLQGPGGDLFPLSTAAAGYFNNWATAGAPPNGFYNLAGKLRVPFFTDIKVHLHATPTGASTAQIAIMGGWPAPDSQAADLGWSVGGNNYFNTAVFDPTSDGWPAAQSVAFADYENSPSTQYRPRAQRDWIEVAFFDYPLQWNPALREFAGFQDAQVILPVINVNSRLKEISPGKVDFDFAQDVTLQLPQIKALDFLNDAVNEIDGPLVSVSNAVRGALSATFDTIGLNELQQTLREDALSFFTPVLDSALDPVVNQLYAQLAGFPQGNLADFLSNAVFVVNSSTLSSALNNLNGAAGQANTVIGQLDGTMNDVQRDLGVLLQILAKDPASGDRHVVSAILKQLVQDQGPALGFVANLGDDAIDTLVTNLNPTLDEIQSQLQDLNNSVAQVHTSLTAASGDFNQALGEVLSDANATQQFVQSAATDLTNLLATALGPAGDYFSADPNAAKQAIKQQLVTAFLGSAMPASYQQTLKQFLFDDNAVLDELMDTLFDQINGAIRDGLAAQITDAQDGALQAVKGLASGSFLSAKIRGAPTFNGDSLRKIHLDAAIQLNVPDPMNFNAYMEILELDSQSVPLDCIPAGAPAAEITLGAKNVKLDWGSLNPSGTPLTLSIAAKWTLQSGNVIGVGGSFDIKGKVGFQGCSVNEIGAALAFGATENYFAAKAAGTITILGIPVDLQAGVFVGKACSLDPILFIDPEANEVLGGGAGGFAGIYVEFGAGLSLSEILFGESDCFIDIEETEVNAVFYNGGPSKQQLGMRQKVSADLSLLCLLSGGANFTMFGTLTHTVSGFELDLGGSAQICGSIGPCPFCISGCKGITVTGVVNNGGVDYHVDY